MPSSLEISWTSVFHCSYIRQLFYDYSGVIESPSSQYGVSMLYTLYIYVCVYIYERICEYISIIFIQSPLKHQSKKHQVKKKTLAQI